MQYLTMLLFFVSASMLQAQDWYRSELVGQKFPGYVVTNAGEKLSGLIVYQPPHKMVDHVKFYPDTNPEKMTKYEAEELKAYFVKKMLWESLEDRDYLVLKKNNQYFNSFCLVVKKGCISIYESYIFGFIGNEIKQNERGETVNEISLNPVQDVQHFMIKGEDKKKVSMKDTRFLFFAKGMSKFLADDPELAQKIKNKEKGYRRIHMYRIIDEYNGNCKNR